MTSPNDLPQKGEGKILDVNGEYVAIYRDEIGELHGFSPLCTHEMCEIEWNGDDKNWQCPCHGSQYYPDGSVKEGPAEEPLSARVIIIDGGNVQIKS